MDEDLNQERPWRGDLLVDGRQANVRRATTVVHDSLHTCSESSTRTTAPHVRSSRFVHTLMMPRTGLEFGGTGADAGDTARPAGHRGGCGCAWARIALSHRATRLRWRRGGSPCGGPWCRHCRSSGSRISPQDPACSFPRYRGYPAVINRMPATTTVAAAARLGPKRSLKKRAPMMAPKMMLVSRRAAMAARVPRVWAQRTRP